MAEKWPRDMWLEAIWEDSSLKPNERVVAYAYARYAGKGWETWCSWSEVKLRTGIRSKDAVWRAIHGLIRSGWLKEVEPPRQHRSAVYRLTVPIASGPGNGPLNGSGEHQANVRPNMSGHGADSSGRNPDDGMSRGTTHGTTYGTTHRPPTGLGQPVADPAETSAGTGSTPQDLRGSSGPVTGPGSPTTGLLTGAHPNSPEVPEVRENVARGPAFCDQRSGKRDTREQIESSEEKSDIASASRGVATPFGRRHATMTRRAQRTIAEATARQVLARAATVVMDDQYLDREEADQFVVWLLKNRTDMRDPVAYVRHLANEGALPTLMEHMHIDELEAP